MNDCSGCKLILPQLFSCDHCELAYCIICLKKHAAELTMTYRHVPSMVKS